MNGIDSLKQDVQEGRIDLPRLLDLLAAQQRHIQALQQQLQTTQQRTHELEHELAKLRGTPTDKLDQPFSVRAEEQRQQARAPKKRKQPRPGRRGRLRTQDKIERAERTEAVYPEGVAPEACQPSHLRPVWRLENGRAVLVAYHIYRGPSNQYGRIPGVLGRSEFGLEIVTEIAYLVYIVGLSFDKVCLLLNFFQNLRLRKSQADALLTRLARHWQHEFDVLCTLLANSFVVHADETSWSLNSVWALLSEKARLLLFGVHKDGATLQQILDPATFAGIVISDDASVYGNFNAAQKCWAHLLRKAIKLTLQAAENAVYRTFTDGLLALYHEACRVQRDGRLSDAGRARKVAVLEDAVLELCAAEWLAEAPSAEGLDADYRRLVNEVMRLALARELFTFVTAPPVTQPNGTVQPVAGTNNEAERTLRAAAQARQTGRTNKTLSGARRQSIVTSVLESLRLYLRTFTLSTVLAELARWWSSGRSCFEELLEKLALALPKKSKIDQVLPHASG
jgi:transposase